MYVIKVLYIQFKSLSARIGFRRQNPMSVVPALKELKY